MKCLLMVTMSSNPNQLAVHKLKELNEALELVKNVEDRITWPCDFASYPDITHVLNPLGDVASDVREKLEDEVLCLEDQLHEYDLKLEEFKFDNTIRV